MRHPGMAISTSNCRAALPPGYQRGIIRPFCGRLTVTRGNTLYLIIGALLVGAAVLAYQLYQDRHKPEGLNINVGPNGLSIQGK